VGYDGPNQILEIEFNNGSLYEYYIVPDKVYTSFMNASSKGKYFHQFIKNKFGFKKVTL
jgi:hypothetical protein